MKMEKVQNKIEIIKNTRKEKLKKTHYINGGSTLKQEQSEMLRTVFIHYIVMITIKFVEFSFSFLSSLFFRR